MPARSATARRRRYLITGDDTELIANGDYEWLEANRIQRIQS